MPTTTTCSQYDEEVIIPLLAARSCHLPGNDWMADWCQWFRNNHTLFGICFHHRLHPLIAWERCLLLAASVSFGLVAINIVYQLEYRYHVYEPDEELISVMLWETKYSITQGMALLWTLGGLCHSIFDHSLWHIMACPCCHPGGRWGDQSQSVLYKDCGSYALIPVIVALLGFAVFLVLLRASDEEKQQQETTTTMDDDDDDNYNNYNNFSAGDIEINDWKSFSFLAQYGIEILLTWFLYFPIVGTIVFSGILGCNGRLPILGGRPRDLRRVEEGRFGFHRFS